MTVAALRDQLFSLETSLARLAIPLQNAMLVQLFNRCNRLRLRCTSVVIRLDAAEIGGTMPPVPADVVPALSAIAGRVATAAARFDPALADEVLGGSDHVLRRVERLVPSMP
jgi:hypothetical protein